MFQVNGDRENTRSVRQLTLKVTSVFTPGPESAGPPLFKEYKDIIPKIISIEGKLLKWTKIFRRLRKQSKL